MRGGPQFRNAITASIAAHFLIAGCLVLFAYRQPNSPEIAPTVEIDTRASVRMEFLPEEIATGKANSQDPMESVSAAEAVATPAVEAEKLTDRGQPTIRAGSVSDGSMVLIRKMAMPQTLPAEFFKVIRKTPIEDHSVRPAAATTPAKTGPLWAEGGSPVHGALAPKQCIVYVLDMSGSMGEWSKFDLARRTLLATLRMQPESVRFQIVVYSGTANVPLRGAPGECLPATRRNIERTIAALQMLRLPAGRSNHVEGVRTALAFRPDLMLLFTDGDDLPLAAFRGMIHQAERPAVLCVAKVGMAAVEKPVSLK